MGRRLALGLFGLAVLVTGCAEDAPLDTLEPQGPESQSIQDLVGPVFLVAGVVFVVVQGAILWLALRYRRRSEGDEPDETLPPQTHGNIPLELTWTVLPAILLGLIGVATLVTIFDLSDRPDDALEVTVTGQQWWWSFGYDTDGDGVDDIVTPNEMVIPAGTPVNVDITSEDVIHSFWIPALNGKRDAVPGRVHHLTLEADEPGTYLGQCTEYCGLSHANMRMRVIALEPEGYEAWLAAQAAAAEAPTTEAAQVGLATFESSCVSCHLIRGVNDDNYSSAAQVSGTAPELTHLMSRSTFAGSLFSLYTEADDPAFDYLALADSGTINLSQLEAWLRDPPAEKPMAPDPAGNSTVGRGMPDLNLTEDQIDGLVAYLTTLK